MKEKILVVDDENDILNFLSAALGGEGYQVLTALDGQEGVNQFQEFSPDLVITDMKMPRKDGLQLLKEIKGSGFPVDVLILTGHSDEATAIECLRSGAYDYLVKPLEEFVKKERTTHEKKWIEVIARKGVIANVEKNIYLKGGIKIPVLMSGSVIHDDKGEVQGFICLLMDNTQRKKAEASLKEAYEELKKTQVQLIQSGKLASIGELASGVAHELNQPLMVIRGMAQLIQRNFRKNHLNHDELMTQLDPIVRNSKRMMNIINHLRTFSRQSTSDFVRVDVNQILEDSFLMIGEQLRLRNIQVNKQFASDLPKIKGDPNQLEQVFLNLIANARDAVEMRDDGQRPNTDSVQERGEHGGSIILVTQKGGVSHRPFKDVIEILIRDNGCGISADKVDKIFDPFFTTKAVGKGTGLGLSISYGIIKEHQGEIEVVDTGPDGTTFRIKLPIPDSIQGSGN